MKPQSYVVATIPFDEHNFTTNAADGEHGIIITSPYSSQKYCENLFQKLLTIGLSEFASFLDHQCATKSQPVLWLNTLEKLIKINMNAFSTSNLLHRHTKLIFQICIKRHSLQEKTSTQNHIPKMKVNGFTADKEYSFSNIKDQSSKYETTDEKVAFLQDQIFEYQLNPPEYINQKELAFDTQCELEIKRLEKQEVMQQKIQNRKIKATATAKLPYEGDLKVLCDIFYKLMRKKSTRGNTFFPWSIAQATDHICNSYCEPDGTALNPSTVRTYLSSSKPESRPKTSHEFKME